MKKYLPIVTVFMGSFLLFGIQPMVGRMLLPPFGGTAAVWTVCLAAYQTLLLVGYFYAHAIAKTAPKVQRILHVGLLAIAVVWAFGFTFKRHTLMTYLGHGSIPALEVLFCVMVVIGLPYVLLSAGSSLVQAWVSGKNPEDRKRGVYRLYAVSNLGSFAGLLFYPFIMEPYVALTAQWWGFSSAMVTYAVFLFFTASYTCHEGQGSVIVRQDFPSPIEKGPPSLSRWLWLGIPMASVILLNAVTTHLTLDVLPLPLLWVVLLAVFLLSYVIGFSSFSGKALPVFLSGAIISGGFLAWRDSDSGFMWTLISSVIFVLCATTFLHSWLFQLRPHTAHLTRYYLGNAMGGAIGGLLTSLVAPMVFRSVLEYPVSLALIAVMMTVWAFNRHEKKTRQQWIQGWVVIGFLGIVSGAVWGILPKSDDRPVIHYGRGFFGTLQVLEANARTSTGEGVIREYIHGNTVHGIQALIPGYERKATTYFSERGGGWAILNHPKYKNDQPMRVNVLGLGVGVILGYARSNDYYRAYEISKDAIDIATNANLFTFVSSSPTPIDIVHEDARKGLEKELVQGVEPYDVLLIDAFTGDNLPYHLSTKEAFALYFKMLKPDGILAVNVSNRYLNLTPFIKSIADEFDCPILGFDSLPDKTQLIFASKFAFFCRQPHDSMAIPSGVKVIDFSHVKPFILPTDERGSFVPLIRW